VTQYETFEKINVEKLIEVLNKQDKELKYLRNDTNNFKNEFTNLRKKNREELTDVHKKFRNETNLKNLAI
jgi:hypothetical protein